MKTGKRQYLAEQPIYARIKQKIDWQEIGKRTGEMPNIGANDFSLSHDHLRGFANV
jgi:hypothetical protein